MQKITKIILKIYKRDSSLSCKVHQSDRCGSNQDNPSKLYDDIEDLIAEKYNFKDNEFEFSIVLHF